MHAYTQPAHVTNIPRREVQILHKCHYEREIFFLLHQTLTLKHFKGSIDFKETGLTLVKLKSQI